MAALSAAAAFTPAEREGRLLIIAVTAGVLARFITDWRACLTVTVFAALVFVGFLAHRAGDLTGDLSPWPDTIVIASAALLGRGRRWMHALQVPGGGGRSFERHVRFRDVRPPGLPAENSSGLTRGHPVS